MKNKPFVFFIVLVLGFLAVFGLGWKTLAAPVQQDATPTEDAPNPRMAYDRFEGLPHFDTAQTPEKDVETLSPDVYVPWSQIVFESYRDSNWEIYLADGSGANHTRLTWDAQADIHPRLNRGCTRIVFASKRTGNYELFAMNPDSSGLTQLTNNTTDDVNPSWSPDGTRIVFQTYRDGQAEIYSMNADGSGQTRLTWDGNYDGMPSWSPDGSKIAFVSRRTGSYNVYVMNPDSSGLVRLSNQSYSQEPSWSPDGSKIAYAAETTNDGWLELWTMNANGTNQYRLYTPGYYQDALPRSWSPDGQYIAFTQVRYVYDQGQWYWTAAYLYAGTTGGNNYLLSGFNTEWNPDWQSSDIAVPASTMAALPPESPYLFTVSWSGSDGAGSGVKNYDVQVLDTANGVWINWLMATTSTSDQYTGIGGHTYYFRVRARDNVGNIEAWGDVNAWTKVEAYAPTTSVKSLPAYSQNLVVVQWSGHDLGNSGIASYDVQYRDAADGIWVDWSMGATYTTTYFSGLPGHSYDFRVRGKDFAQNVEDWSQKINASTKIYIWSFTGIVQDLRGISIAGTSVEVTPGLMETVATDSSGNYITYNSESSGTFTTTWEREGYGTLSPLYSPASAKNRLTILPSQENLIRNGEFEAPALSQWNLSGAYSPVVTSTVQHTGGQGVFLGAYTYNFSPRQKIGSTVAGEQSSPRMIVDQYGGVHVVWVDQADILYAYRDQNGNWQAPLAIGNATYLFRLRLIADSFGSVHIVWENNAAITHIQRYKNGQWSNMQIIYGSHFWAGMEVDIDSTGSLHFVWVGNSPTGANRIWYVCRDAQGNWSKPVIILTGHTHADDPYLIVDQKDIVHVVWGEMSNISYARKNRAGIWQTETIFQGYNITVGNPKMAVDAVTGDIHAVWYGWTEGVFYYKNRNSIGEWSDLEIVADTNRNSPDNVRHSLGIDKTGKLHVLLQVEDYTMHYFQRLPDGTWSNGYPVSDPESGDYPSLLVDNNNNVHMVWKTGDTTTWEDIYYIRHNADGTWSPKINLSNNIGPNSVSTMPALTLDNAGQPYIIWDDGGNGNQGIYFSGPAPVAETGDSTLSQSVTIPITMTAPTLSFLYDLYGASPAGGSGFSVTVSDEFSDTVIFSTSTNTDDWTHAWFDLSPWISQTITLTFNIHEEAGFPYAWAFLDEVTVGSANPDLWVHVAASPTALPGEPLVYEITYANRGGADAENVLITHTLPAELTLLSASLPYTQTGSILTWEVGDLAAQEGPATIRITATVGVSTPLGSTIPLEAGIIATTPELETANNSFQGHTFIGWQIYFPFLRKD